MLNRVIHPGTMLLLRYQSLARASRLVRGFTTPRRCLLSIFSLVLAVFWLGNIAVSIAFREPTTPENFRGIVSACLLAYALWHLLKVACRRPDDPYEWSPAERQFLLAAPLSRHQLVGYRLMSILVAAFIKALCFSLLMLPELRVWSLGIIGGFLALVFLDLLRFSVEIAVCAMNPRTYARLRFCIISAAAAVGLSCLIQALLTMSRMNAASPITLFTTFVASIASLRNTPLGAVLELPFSIFANLIGSTDFSTAAFGRLGLALATVVAGALLVLRLDRYSCRKRLRFEWQAVVSGLKSRGKKVVVKEQQAGLPQVLSRMPLSALAWRQWIGTLNHGSGMAIALAAPAIFSLAPLAGQGSPSQAALHVLASLSFFTFLLIPAAMKFDFRRDVSRIGHLKSLPLTPTSTVAGQLATPVAVSTVYQLVVVALACLALPSQAFTLLVGLALLIPLNVFIFSLENLIFLLYPYRMNQEGLDVFLRTILTFTAKGLLFAFGAGAIVAWAYIGQEVIGTLIGSRTLHGTLVFAAGLAFGLVTIAMLTCYALVRAFARFDPSLDTPA